MSHSSSSSAAAGTPNAGTEMPSGFHEALGLRRPQLMNPSNGLCYMSAPIVLQHYLVALHQPDVGMIDMRTLVLQTFSAAELKQYLVEDDGGASEEVLRSILEEGSVVTLTQPGQYEASLRLYGSGLVTNFMVDDHAAESRSFDGRPEGRIVGLHAMVLIGTRRDAGTAKLWLLLQNWWRHSQFVEVSEEYLSNCGAAVYFVETPQSKIPERFPTQGQLSGLSDVDKPVKLFHAA